MTKKVKVHYSMTIYSCCVSYSDDSLKAVAECEFRTTIDLSFAQSLKGKYFNGFTSNKMHYMMLNSIFFLVSTLVMLL